MKLCPKNKSFYSLTTQSPYHAFHQDDCKCWLVTLDCSKQTKHYRKGAVNKDTHNLDTDNHTDKLNYRGVFCKVYYRECLRSGKNILFSTLAIMKGAGLPLKKKPIINHESIEKSYQENKMKMNVPLIKCLYSWPTSECWLINFMTYHTRCAIFMTSRNF